VCVLGKRPKGFLFFFLIVSPCWSVTAGKTHLQNVPCPCMARSRRPVGLCVKSLVKAVVRGVRSSHRLSGRGSVTVEQHSWYAPWPP